MRRRLAWNASSAAGWLLGVVLLGRWLALLAVGYLSLHLWSPTGYFKYGRTWQYQLVLTDPRVAAALLWGLQWGAFLLFIAYPAGRWISARIPRRGQWRIAALGILAIGLGTRGIIGPLVGRAAFGLPMEAHPGGGEQVLGLLMRPGGARWAVSLVEMWWLLPLIILACRFPVLPRQSHRGKGYLGACLVCLAALQQPMDVPYLMVAGGPRGATTSIQFLAFLEGFGEGRNVLGYASALTFLLAFVSIPVGIGVGKILARAPGCIVHHTGVAGPKWLLGLTVVFLPLLVAIARNPAWPSAGNVWGWFVVSGLTAGLGGAWTAFLAMPLSHWLTRTSLSPVARSAVAGAMLLPSLILVLPMARLAAVHGAGLLGVMGWALLTLGAPYLFLAAMAAALCRALGGGERRAAVAAASAAAWGVWTEMLIPIALFGEPQHLTTLPHGMLWALSTHLWRSPLAVPGWPLAWIGASLLAWAAACACIVPSKPSRCP